MLLKRTRKLAVQNLFVGHNRVKLTIELSKDAHTMVKDLLLSTGEEFVEDAVQVLLVTMAATDNQQVFAVSERARALVSTFRQMLSMLTREAVERFNADTERQLNEFINTLHATEEDQ